MRDITIRQFFGATRDRRGRRFSSTWSAAIIGGITARADVHASASRGARYAQPTYQQAVM